MNAFRATTLLMLVMTLVSCSVDPLDGGNITVTLQSQDALVSAADPGTYRITATNSSDSRIEWGSGSSSCQLSLFVVGTTSTRLNAADVRACTADFVPHALNAGESRTETITWGGEVVRDGRVELLPAGAYRLVAAAGEKGESAPYEVRVAVIPQ